MEMSLKIVKTTMLNEKILNDYRAKIEQNYFIVSN